MTIIDRYILKELLKIFFLAIFVLTAVMFLDKILYLTDLITNKGISGFAVCKLLVYISPAFLVLTIPMGILVSSLITCNRLSSDSEFIALTTSGYSFYRLLRPVIILSVGAYLATNFLMIYALPWGNYSFKKSIFTLLKSNVNINLKERIFNNDFKNLLIYINEKEESSNLMKGIFIADSTEQNNTRIISAKNGVLASDPETLKVAFVLNDGAIHDTDKGSEQYRLLTFSKYTLQLDLDTLSYNEKIMKGNREMSLQEIKKRIASLKKNNRTYFGEAVELHKKFSIPFTCLILGLIGAPLGIKSSRAGKSGGFALSLGIILFYYISLIAGESLGDAGKVDPMLAMWFPNIVILGTGIFLTRRAQRL